jgi:predicted amidohydrolase YtcJ
MLQAERIFINGKIYTMANERETGSAMAVMGGKIIAAGTDDPSFRADRPK